MDDDKLLLDVLSHKPGKSTFEVWQEIAAKGDLEGKNGFTFYAFSYRLGLLQRWIEGDAHAFDLVKQAVKRWEDTGALPPDLDWRYWESHNHLPPFVIP